jgi:hypothetical protein
MRTGHILDWRRTRQEVVLQKFGQPVKAKFNPFLDLAGCTIVMRRQPRLQAIFLRPNSFFLKPCRGTVDILCKHLSPGDESACHPNPESLRQVERNPFNAGATIWRTAGSIWTLNQGDGSLTRVDAKSRKVMATITLGIPGPGGDICYSADSVWASVFGVPLSQVDVKTNKLLRQWVGRGGDSLRFGQDSLWLTDSHHGLVWRIPNDATQGRIP